MDKIIVSSFFRKFSTKIILIINIAWHYAGFSGYRPNDPYRSITDKHGDNQNGLPLKPERTNDYLY
jgi:hypothetical protein